MVKKFIEISNRDIYDEIKELRTGVEAINNHLIKTNGSIKDNTKRITGLNKMIVGGFGFSMAILGFLISHLLQ